MKKEPLEPVFVRLPRSLTRALDAYARERLLSRSAVVRMLLSEALSKKGREAR